MTAHTFAPGMAEALAKAETFASEAEAAAFWAEGAPEVPTEDLSYPGGAGQSQAARLYRGTEPGVLLYIHGGGWVGGSIALNEPACRTLAARSGWSVLSISYRLAPDHPYPAGLTDCRAALRWLLSAAAPFEVDPKRIALGGASAGANLALATALAEPHPCAGLLLFYGVFGADTDTETHARYAAGPGITRARVEEIYRLYDPEGRRHTDPLIAPLLADPAGLPPTALITAEIDVLRADSARLHARLQAAGVPARYHCAPGVTHGFINRGRLVPAAQDCLARAAAFLETLPPSSF